jgi:hypothetical protein
VSLASSHVETAATTGREGRRLSREAKLGAVAVAAVVTARIVIGSFVVNEWEGWGTFLSFAITAAVEGIVLGALVFGLLVRLAVRSHGTRPAVTALIVGILAALSLAIPYSAPQPIIGMGALALGLAARDRPESRPGLLRLAGVGIALGLLVITAWISFVFFTIVTGDWPVSVG